MPGQGALPRFRAVFDAESAVERVRDVAQVGTFELYTPEFEASARFYVDQLGLEQVGRTPGRTYLHTWDDYGAVTLTLIDAKQAGIGRTFMRASGPNALRRRVAAIDAAGLGERWTDEVPGQSVDGSASYADRRIRAA